jgi:carbon-monoxide dehydrogenase large subunit
VASVDAETGWVHLERLWAVDDVGTVVNPMLAAGQRHGGIVQGIGQALFEETVYDEDGNLRSSSFLDYLLPTAEDVPPIELHGTSHPSPHNPIGAKGVGEAGAIGTPPAVVNAVVDALAGFGVDHLDLPLRPERVWAAMQG